MHRRWLALALVCAGCWTGSSQKAPSSAGSTCTTRGTLLSSTARYGGDGTRGASEDGFLVAWSEARDDGRAIIIAYVDSKGAVHMPARPQLARRASARVHFVGAVEDGYGITWHEGDASFLQRLSSHGELLGGVEEDQTIGLGGIAKPRCESRADGTHCSSSTGTDLVIPATATLLESERGNQGDMALATSPEGLQLYSLSCSR